MCTLIVSELMTLDGVVEAPGGVDHRRLAAQRNDLRLPRM